jgi:uncharacterized caspase-like protein
VLARVAAAKRLQLVILDACRENPFRQTMAGPIRSIGERGLARIEPSLPNLLVVAYAARDGQVALDGKAGEGSPYAKALVKHLAEPGLELSVFFRRVRQMCWPTLTASSAPSSTARSSARTCTSGR